MRNPIPKLPTNLQYYSFWLGEPDAPRSQWILNDLKIPAQSPLHALYMRCFAHGWKARKSKAPTLSDMWVQSVQRIVEYEKVREQGCTVVVFRRVRVHRNPLKTRHPFFRW
jgi:hypothetical protein